jgi:hypothetical protein
MSLVRKTQHAPRAVVGKMPLLPKLLIAIFSGAMVAAAAAQALQMLLKGAV